MAEEDVFESLIDESGYVVRGLRGGLQEILIRLGQMEQKIDELNGKIPEAKTG